MYRTKPDVTCATKENIVQTTAKRLARLQGGSATKHRRFQQTNGAGGG